MSTPTDYRGRTKPVRTHKRRKTQQVTTNRFIPFGKYRINITRLLDDSVVIIRYANQPISVPTLPAFHVSKPLQDILKHILKYPDDKHFPKEPFQKLIPGEQETLLRLLQKADYYDTNLSVLTGVDLSSLKHQGMERLDTLLGELEAGNTNGALRSEIHELVENMRVQRLLPKHEVQKLLFRMHELSKDKQKDK